MADTTLKFNASLTAWNSDDFTTVIKKEICALNTDQLPLQQGLSHSNYANADNLSATILSIESNSAFILVKVGLFYTGMIAGCNCADDPSPVDEVNEYCEVLLQLDKTTAETSVTLLQQPD